MELVELQVLSSRLPFHIISIFYAFMAALSPKLRGSRIEMLLATTMLTDINKHYPYKNS